jgi:hypothetical protein
VAICKPCQIVLEPIAYAKSYHANHWKKAHHELSKDQVGILLQAYKDMNPATIEKVVYPGNGSYIPLLPVFQGGYQCQVDQPNACRVVKASAEEMVHHYQEVHGIDPMPTEDSPAFWCKENVLYQCFFPGRIGDGTEIQSLWAIPEDTNLSDRLPIRHKTDDKNPLDLSQPNSQAGASKTNSTMNNNRRSPQRISVTASGSAPSRPPPSAPSNTNQQGPAQNQRRQPRPTTPVRQAPILNIGQAALMQMMRDSRGGTDPQHQLWAIMEEQVRSTFLTVSSFNEMISKGQLSVGQATEMISYSLKNASERIMELSAEAKRIQRDS